MDGWVNGWMDGWTGGWSRDQKEWGTHSSEPNSIVMNIQEILHKSRNNLTILHYVIIRDTPTG